MTDIRLTEEGWQAVIADGFTFENVARLARAYAVYLLGRGGQRAVVGYDTRFLSARFAQRVAEVLVGCGLEVHLAKGYLPTPALAFALRHLGADGGVMVTGGARPAEYAGLVFLDRDGGGLAAEARALLEDRLGQPAPEGQGRLQVLDVRKAYYQALLAPLDLEALRAYSGVVYHETMGGATAGWFSGLVKEAGLGLELRELHAVPDALFYGVVPSPEPQNLFTLTALLKVEQEPTLALIHDGDGSRLGVGLAGGRLLSAEEVAALLVFHLYHKGRRGKVVWPKEGGLVEGVARRLGLEVVRAGPCQEGVLLGGDGTGRLYFGHPQSDGLQAGVLLLELLARRGQGLGALLAGLVE
ncbi:phosphoglucomutase/phosphomannomutase family protein [Meiothermus sp. QL-1]|uniref:phosphoglucomutase/phosphomannomutase family protein n=1 Tax=Meiothermus sp. QL-1 TaxID=2058095 RepID=UPI000E0CA554|nr:phosphoglucomutase/phosphomannomutase family protein [Meiothermus sp. QL-1]RDI96677.1 phosphoglucomutase/phosphomannomutase family protein [Meiothermus sp. QL-1]